MIGDIMVFEISLVYSQVEKMFYAGDIRVDGKKSKKKSQEVCTPPMIWAMTTIVVNLFIPD